MFNKNELVDKVSNMTLLRLMKSGSIDDETVGDYTDFSTFVYDPEDRPIVTVRLPIEMKEVQELIILKMKKDKILSLMTKSSIIYKYASKLGAIILLNKDYIKHLNEVHERKVKLLEYINNELYDSNPDLYEEAMADISVVSSRLMFTASEIKMYWGTKTVRISFRPFPRWHYVLADISSMSNVSISDIYRMAILYAFATETKVPTMYIKTFEGLMNRLVDWYDQRIKDLEEKYYAQAKF